MSKKLDYSVWSLSVGGEMEYQIVVLCVGLIDNILASRPGNPKFVTALEEARGALVGLFRFL